MVKNRGGRENLKKHKEEKMKKIQRIVLAFMLGIMPIQSALADSRADELVNAALNGDLEQVKTLIEKEGVDINAKESKFGATALMYASAAGELEVVKYLINKGADINAKANLEINGKNFDGFTALIGASTNGHLEVVKYLISKGANVNAVATMKVEGIVYNVTALDGAINNKRHKIIEVLKNAGAKSAKEIQK